MTKPITGTAMMMLYDEGKFSLDDPVQKYLPEFQDMQVLVSVNDDGSFNTEPAMHPMTIRELMSHTGGLVYNLALSNGPIAQAYSDVGVLDRDSNLQEMAAKIGQIPLAYQPGTQWVYSVSVDVQGYLVEVLSGLPFDVFLKERIFEPLGMVDTDFYVHAENASRLSRTYRRDEDDVLVSDPNGRFLEKPSLFSGGGGLTSTAEDYYRFTQMQMNKGELDGIRLISEESAMLMRQNQLPDAVENIGPFYPGNVFGLDFAIVNDAEADGAGEGSFWWWGAQGTWFWIDPEAELTFIGLIQIADFRYARQLQMQSRRILYQ